MCLAIPALIKRIDGFMADVDINGIEMRANIQFTPHAKAGDYIIIHAGYGISVLDIDEAEETLKLLKEIAGTDGHQ
ncbi:MAG: HypC/HybG/HupF family hydrogenase formation chaperone [Syntrophorhabdaceae bacterium]|nr:HypC/HybG/HupF family hydrogenase formation chaperone [Syntrophorhabdaceae bacterium]